MSVSGTYDCVTKTPMGDQKSKFTVNAQGDTFTGQQAGAMGQKLDPHLHQAMIEVPDDKVEAGTIVQEMQSGYTIKDRLLRPALVGVARKP